MCTSRTFIIAYPLLYCIYIVYILCGVSLFFCKTMLVSTTCHATFLVGQRAHEYLISLNLFNITTTKIKKKTKMNTKFIFYYINLIFVIIFQQNFRQRVCVYWVFLLYFCLWKSPAWAKKSSIKIVSCLLSSFYKDILLPTLPDGLGGFKF